ncbi:MAG: DUF2294 family protein [Actinobacteria bacterium]|nr:MAG: DUF2294 family protein [Actinomycetota bacterium]
MRRFRAAPIESEYAGRRRCRRDSNASSPSCGPHTHRGSAWKVSAMDDQRERQSPGGMISTSAVQLMHDCTGRGPTKAKTMINENVVTVLLADTLTAGERHLVDNGRADHVLTLRHDFQLVMRDDLVGIVERQLDRKVIAFMSQNHIDPDLAVEVFVLEPPTSAEPS